MMLPDSAGFAKDIIAKDLGVSAHNNGASKLRRLGHLASSIAYQQVSRDRSTDRAEGIRLAFVVAKAA